MNIIKVYNIFYKLIRKMPRGRGKGGKTRKRGKNLQ